MTAAHPLVVEMTRVRTGRGVTHTGIHDATGIARSTIRNWETGRRDPQLAMFDTYLRSLGLRLAIVPLEEPAETIDDDLGEQIPFGELVVGDGEKRCSSCRQVRATRDFHTDNSRRDGLKYRCRFCCNDANRRADHRNRHGREAAA